MKHDWLTFRLLRWLCRCKVSEILFRSRNDDKKIQVYHVWNMLDVRSRWTMDTSDEMIADFDIYTGESNELRTDELERIGSRHSRPEVRLVSMFLSSDWMRDYEVAVPTMTKTVQSKSPITELDHQSFFWPESLQHLEQSWAHISWSCVRWCRCRYFFDILLELNQKEHKNLSIQLVRIGILYWIQEPLHRQGWKNNVAAHRGRETERYSLSWFSRSAFPFLSGWTSRTQMTQIRNSKLVAVHIGEEDVQDYFHRLRIKLWLRLLCLPPVSVRTFNVMELDHKHLITLVLSMKFSWFLCFPEKLSEQHCHKSRWVLTRRPLKEAGNISIVTAVGVRTEGLSIRNSLGFSATAVYTCSWVWKSVSDSFHDMGCSCASTEFILNALCCQAQLLEVLTGHCWVVCKEEWSLGEWLSVNWSTSRS